MRTNLRLSPFRRILMALLLTFAVGGASAQTYHGMSGLIAAPSADMHAEGDAEIGACFLSKDITPKFFSYNTWDIYFNITPFRWVEMAYTMTFMRGDREKFGNKLVHKDRSLSLKFNPLREGKYWPAIAIGGNDVVGSGFKFRDNDDSNSFFSNFYAVATKHFSLWGQDVSANIAYRYCPLKSNRNWQGVAGGVTVSPSFYPPLRFIAEYNAKNVNIGADCLLWRHLYAQVSLSKCRYFSGGLAYRVNLF